jgi:hypothetical protein
MRCEDILIAKGVAEARQDPNQFGIGTKALEKRNQLGTRTRQDGSLVISGKNGRSAPTPQRPSAVLWFLRGQPLDILRSIEQVNPEFRAIVFQPFHLSLAEEVRANARRRRREPSGDGPANPEGQGLPRIRHIQNCLCNRRVPGRITWDEQIGGPASIVPLT